MDTQPLPPRGPRRFISSAAQRVAALRVRESRFAAWVRSNAMLVAALCLLLVVGVLSLFSKSGSAVNPNDPTATISVRTTPTPTQDPAQVVLTPTGSIDPPTPGARVTPIPTESAGGGFLTPELPGLPYPVFNPTPGFDVVPTLPVFDEQITLIPLTPVPTLPQVPGSNPSRPTALPTQDLVPLPTLGIDPYPVPTDSAIVPTVDPGTEPEPTNIPPFPSEDPLDLTPEPTEPLEPTETPEPTIPPTPVVDRLTGEVHWTLAQSPVRLNRETVIARGAALVIDPGVEVRLASGISLVVDGNLRTAGTLEAPVRFLVNGTGRWKSIVVNPGGFADLTGVNLADGGADGVVVSALGGKTVIADSRIERTGRILGLGGSLDIQRSIITEAAPIDAQVPAGGSLKLLNNTITNTSADGSTGVAVSASNPDVEITVTGNRITGSSGVNLQARLDVPLEARFECNTFKNGSVGLSIKTFDPTLDGSHIYVTNNAFLTHRVYGLVSDVGLGAKYNWWGDASGPYYPEQNTNGTGDAVGVNITFRPWLTASPACAP